MPNYCLKNSITLKKRNSFSQKLSLTKCSAFNLTLTGLFFSLLLVYLWQVNGLASTGYQINDLRNQAQELQQQNESLTNEYGNLQSMQNLDAKIDELKMVSISQTDYLTSLETALAR
ncbi:MAG: hypothetical protein WCW02_00745 [Candidatus Buchananbacteria bacterium]